MAAARLRTRRVFRLALLTTFAVVGLFPAAAMAGTAGDYPTPTTGPPPCTSTYPAPPPECQQNSVGASQASRSSSSLPFTGGDVALLTVVGLVVAGGGVALVLAGRRVRARATT